MKKTEAATTIKAHSESTLLNPKAFRKFVATLYTYILVPAALLALIAT